MTDTAPHAHLRFIEVVRGHGEAQLIQDQGHERSVTHVSRYLVRYVHVLQPWYTFHWPEASDCIESTTRSAEQIVQKPVVPRVSVDESSRYHRSNLSPCPHRRGDRRTHDEYVLHNTIGFLLGKFEQSVEDNSRTERETDERDRSNSQMSLNQNVGEDSTGRLRSVKSVRPRVIN